MPDGEHWSRLAPLGLEVAAAAGICSDLCRVSAFASLPWVFLMAPFVDVRKVSFEISTGFQSLINLSPFRTIEEAATFAGRLLLSIVRDANEQAKTLERDRDAYEELGSELITIQPGDEEFETTDLLTQEEVLHLIQAFQLKLSEVVIDQLEAAHLPDRNFIYQT